MSVSSFETGAVSAETTPPPALRATFSHKGRRKNRGGCTRLSLPGLTRQSIVSEESFLAVARVKPAHDEARYATAAATTTCASSASRLACVR
jgi:hypothetical protein